MGDDKMRIADELEDIILKIELNISQFNQHMETYKEYLIEDKIKKLSFIEFLEKLSFYWRII
jgi:hypothetical protein